MVIDLRAFPDNRVSGNGKRTLNTQDGISLCIHKEKTPTLGDLVCHTFVVSDRIADFINRTFKDVKI